ncbi:MAG: hypothetical protein HY931_02235 [Candidatus Falkowbacteria bacterium]|nr:MAG: hypothetical protein HY931_02235 [Candidatus Falkowbacteria bacterium]
MKKNIKKILLLIFVLVLIFLAYLLVNISLKEKKVNTPADVNNQDSAQPAAEFVPEMMTESEKVEMKLGPQLNLQVISRDADGKVEAYKIIRSESDIINLNQ